MAQKRGGQAFRRHRASAASATFHQLKSVAGHQVVGMAHTVSLVSRPGEQRSRSAAECGHTSALSSASPLPGAPALKPLGLPSAPRSELAGSEPALSQPHRTDGIS